MNVTIVTSVDPGTFSHVGVSEWPQWHSVVARIKSPPESKADLISFPYHILS